jgi:hypothetical protein
MSIHDHVGTGHGSADHHDSSLSDNFGQIDLSIDRHKRHDPSNLAGDYHLFFGSRKTGPSIEPPTKSHSSSLPVARIALMMILGVWGAVILIILMSVV